jgi:predicted small secreted protein
MKTRRKWLAVIAIVLSATLALAACTGGNTTKYTAETQERVTETVND